MPTTGADAPVYLPPLWHWVYFMPTAPLLLDRPVMDIWSIKSGFDSTLRRRRLVAGLGTEFLRPLRNRRTLANDGAVLGRRDKARQSGPFPDRHSRVSVLSERCLCVREERDIVYLQGRLRAQLAPMDGSRFKTASDRLMVSLFALDPRSRSCSCVSPA